MAVESIVNLQACIEKLFAILREDIKKNYDAIESVRKETKDEVRDLKNDIMERINRNVMRLDKLEDWKEKVEKELNSGVSSKESERRIDEIEKRLAKDDGASGVMKSLGDKAWLFLCGIGAILGTGITEIVIPWIKGMM